MGRRPALIAPANVGGLACPRPSGDGVTPRRPLNHVEDLTLTQVMKGVRILEVAQFTFVPAAGAVLADWGADVIKIEHPVRGDTQRGFINVTGVAVNPLRMTLIEHPNRGKRSVGLDISTPEGQELLYEIAK